MRLAEIRKMTPPELLGAAAEFIRGAVFDNWGAKGLALAVALLVFIVTRDEVQRTFMIPLTVTSDPDRVLLTDVPDEVSVEVRGPWTRVNQIGEGELGSAVLDLREAKPGPMTLDPASIVMPEGVVLNRLDYDAVDLRFEAVVRRELPIVVEPQGAVQEDYKLESIVLDPPVWTVKGRRSAMEGVDALAAEPVSVAGATSDFDVIASLRSPGEGIRFVGQSGPDLPTVRVHVEVVAVLGERELEVAVADAIGDATRDNNLGEVPSIEVLRVRGPLPRLRRLADFSDPIVPSVTVLSPKKGRPTVLELRFSWSPRVPVEVKGGLSIEPAVIRLSIAPRGPTEQEL